MSVEGEEPLLWINGLELRTMMMKRIGSKGIKACDVYDDGKVCCSYNSGMQQ